MDLLEVHLAEIVIAYIERLEERGELDLETATEFLILIAALLELKSQADAALGGRAWASTSIPHEAAEELLARLLEYRKFRAASEWMHARLAGERATATVPRRCRPELRRVTIEAAAQGLRARRGSRTRSAGCCARRRPWTRAT